MDPEKDQQTTPAPTSPAAIPNKDTSLGSILLPNKEVHDPTNAMRADASLLLKQEQSATLPKTPAPPLPPLVQKQPETSVEPLVTYQRDVEKYVAQKKVSAVTIATAEAERRGTIEAPIPKERVGWGGTFLIACGVALLVGTVGALGYGLYKTRSVAVQIADAPLLFIDAAYSIPTAADQTPSKFMDDLESAKNGVALSVGLVAQLYPLATTSTAERPVGMSTRGFLQLLTPNIPAALLRTFFPTFLLGVHSHDRNQPFLLLKVDSYEQGFSGMLAWEGTMQGDLAPLFTYVPSPKLQIPTITDVASTSSSTPALPPAVIPPPPSFVDKIIENHDTRVLQTADGQIYFLWTFIDKNTILITTNEATLREVIVRIKNAPAAPLLGQ